MTRELAIQYCLDNGYVDIINSASSMTDQQLFEIVEASKYPLRRIDGQKYSDFMGARLVLASNTEVEKKTISDFFAISQQYLCQGWWKSALREMKTKQPTALVSQALIDEITISMQNYINRSYV
jgi:hypothetical protein